MPEYRFCTQCARPLDLSGQFPECSVCNVTYYHNSKPCVGVVIIKDGQVLVARRGIDPFKGELDIIGGFLEDGELPTVGALREVTEETGLDIRLTELLNIYSDVYFEGGHTLNIHYIGEIISGTPEPQDDVAALEWYSIDQLPETHSFNNVKETLRDLKIWWDLYKRNSAPSLETVPKGAVMAKKETLEKIEFADSDSSRDLHFDRIKHRLKVAGPAKRSHPHTQKERK